ncbi:integrase [Rhodanobacter sp. K2T2]|uniref:site-specific integrase n=1 Tax=Rhodanobacter sp. K2T2 TaxID=2723085 RepID=UPI0015CD412A|nr:site-specific integrase [Rhodanobacter sp. K2T2]NYE30948.1 integrase [Rhodanobacter sp. K2T2]
MRLAHHLLREKTGIWYFRLVVPKRLREPLGQTIIKRSLATRDPALARAWAYVLGAKYAQLFSTVAQGDQRMAEKQRWDDDVVRRLMGDIQTNAPGGVSKWKVQGPGGWSVETNGSPEDNAGGMLALRAMLEDNGSIIERNLARLAPHRSSAPTLDEAIRDYAEVEGKALKPNTWIQRSRSLTSFSQTIGGHLRVDAITRAMASTWSDGLIRSGKSNVYAANTVSHVAQLFDALLKKDRITTNPVKGLIVVKKKEKAARRSEGHEWEPFDVAVLKRIFDPANLAKTKMEHVRWGTLIGLYTGARVGEIAQIFLRDFVVLGDVKCLKICADSDGQGIKTGEGGERLVPIHPDLLTLGLWERVEALRAAGAERLFPAMRIDSAAGRGNSISKGFSYYLASLGVKPRREHGIVGVHSLRKTVIQTLQGCSLSAERRRAIVGHENGDPPPDTHATAYMRPWTGKELAAFFPGLPWGEWLAFEGLRPLLRLVATRPNPLPKRKKTQIA